MNYKNNRIKKEYLKITKDYPFVSNKTIRNIISEMEENNKKQKESMNKISNKVLNKKIESILPNPIGVKNNKTINTERIDTIHSLLLEELRARFFN